MPDTDKRGESQLSMLAEHLRRPAVLGLILAALVFTLYSATLSFEFVYDDHQQIVNNPLVRSWNSVGRVFVSDLWFHVKHGQLYYRPLFILWSILNYTIFGLKTWGWHLGAVLLHAAGCLSVFVLGRRLKLDYWTSALAGILFAVHPIHIECAAWISAASDSMAAVFCFLAFAAFLRSRENEGRRRLWSVTSCILLGCALLTKESPLPFFVLAGLYAWYFPGEEKTSVPRRLRKAALATLPYLAVTFAYLLVRVAALHRLTGNFDPEHTGVDVLRTLPEVLGLYLRLLVAPYGITGLYYTPYVTTPGFGNFYLPLAAILAFGALLWFWTRRSGDRRIAFLGWWTFIALVPALNLRAFNVGEFVHDRYAYIASAGFLLLAAMAIRQIPGIGRIASSRVQAIAAIVICVVLAAGTLVQQVYWASDILVFKRGYELYPQSAYNMAAYGTVLGAHGQYLHSLQLLQEAARREPGQLRTAMPLAEAYARTGNIEEGRRVIADAMSRGQMDESSELETSELIGLLGRLHEYDRALSLCSTLLRREPNLYSGLYNCGNINFQAGHYPEAEVLLRRAIEQSPTLSDPRYFLGRVLLETGRNTDAQENLRQAIRLRSDVAEYHTWLGVALQQAGDLAGARQEFETAVQLDPENRDIQARLRALTAGK